MSISFEDFLSSNDITLDTSFSFMEEDTTEEQLDIHVRYLDMEIHLPNSPILIDTLDIDPLKSIDSISTYMTVIEKQNYILGIIKENKTTYTLDLYLLKRDDKPNLERVENTQWFMFPFDLGDKIINELNFVFRDENDNIITVWELDNLKYQNSDIIKTLTLDKEIINFN